MADKEVRLIDKDKLIEKINAEIDAWGKARMCMTADELLETIEEFEEEAEFVKYGHWEYRGRDTDGRLIYKCSECGYTLSVALEMNLAMSHEKFCYNCGARMDFKENDER